MTQQLPGYDALPPASAGGRSAWSVFGPAGALELQTPERVVAAARLVRTGQVFALDAPLDLISPPLYGRGAVRHTRLGGGLGHDDVYDNFYPQASSQWDALSHVGYDAGTFFGGLDEAAIAAGRGGIDVWARRGIVGRAVLADVWRAADGGYDPNTAHVITVDALRAALHAPLQPGDVLVVHTGWLQWYAGLEPAARAALARGRLQAVGLEASEEMARLLWDAHVCAVVSDCPAVEVWPPDFSPGAAPFGFLHRMLIGQFGLALGELWWLADLAAACAGDGVEEFLLASAPLHMPGGVGSTANAVAIR